MFRCAEDKIIVNLFRNAGQKNVSQKDVAGKLKVGTSELYWNFINEVAAPVVAALIEADEVTKQKIKKEVTDSINEKYGNNNVAID